MPRHSGTSVASTKEPARRVTRRQKRPNEQSAESLRAGQPQCGGKQAKAQKAVCLQVTLYVRWHSPTGKTRVNRLHLKPVDSVESLEGLSKNLVARAFPPVGRPDYLTSAEFYKYTPAEEFMSLPGDIARTEFRLVVGFEGWEYTVLERELGASRDPSRKMLVTVIEFESTAMMIGHLGVRVSLIAYPVVSISKNFLEGIASELRHNPDFTGIM